jgi:hypothetical protein
MRKLYLVATSALLAAAPLGAQDPAALLVQLSGDVQVRRAGSAPAAAAVGSRLVPGDELLPATGARAVLILRTGAQQVVTSPTTVAQPSAGGDPTLFNRAVATLAQAASAEARASGGRQGMIRPIPGEPVIVAPRNGLTVTSTRPTFEWMAVDGAEGYTIQVRKLESGARPVRFQVENASSWTLPDDQPALAHGATYAWTVAPRPGRPTREQEFRVLDEEQASSLDARLEEISMLGMDPHGDGLFLTAMIYREMDLFYDARSALGGVEDQGAMSADLYLLKGEILNMLGHAEEARAAFDRADALMR